MTAAFTFTDRLEVRFPSPLIPSTVAALTGHGFEWDAKAQCWHLGNAITCSASRGQFTPKDSFHAALRFLYQFGMTLAEAEQITKSELDYAKGY